jgi:phenylpropionate dioxygenase-like ring-hydroxylating dioxygenase large terminal subunit
MMTGEENDLLTRVGRGTPGGNLLRRYWQPVALADELPPGGAPVPVRILGEDLVLFRDGEGRAGLLGLHCSHRGADLSFGRVENGGLRCVYHGWLYSLRGRCLDQPGEPDGGEHKDGVRHPAYPCEEAAGLIFAYMGPGSPPLLPAYEALQAPRERRFARKFFQECSYLQGNEGNIDPVHLSFLHRQFRIEEVADRRQGLGVRGTKASPDSLYAADLSPSIEVDLTDFGLRISTIRSAGANSNYLRVSNFIMPNLCAVPGETGADGYNINWHVPIDDTHHWKFMFTFSRHSDLDTESMRRRNDAEIGPDCRLLRNLSNRYLQNREEMKGRTYSGIGGFFPAHDAFATESQGPIQDRTREHLVSSDKAIVAARKLLLKAIREIQEGREAPHIIRDARANRFPHLRVFSEVLSRSVDVRDIVSGIGERTVP